MQKYRITTLGESLAEDSGLDVLADHLDMNGHDLPPIINALTVQRFAWDDIENTDIPEAVVSVRTALKTDEEFAMFEHGMNVQPQTHVWHQLGAPDQDALIPYGGLETIAQATEEDSFVLSGAAGLSLVNYRNRCHLLARSRYEDYGFDTFNESAAFVGAYVVSRLNDSSEGSLETAARSFSYIDQNFEHTVSIGGTFHGDFVITETEAVRSNIISPIYTRTQFSPTSTFGVLGYHSVEPDIVESLIETEYLNGGAPASLALIEEFKGVLQEAADENGTINHTMGNFADYGSNNSSFSLSRFRVMINHPEYNPLAKADHLYSSRYAPGSAVMFEIVPTEDGIKFQNRHSRDDTEYEPKGILVRREQYPALFKALLGQSTAGIGRTSPHQILRVIGKAEDLLNGDID